MRPLPAQAVRNTIRHGDCIKLMRRMDAASVDFILTDPPYICRYRDSAGRTVANDDNGRWLEPAFAEMFRLLKPDSLCLSFYGWNQADRFISAWRQAGFRLVGHMVFQKPYASSARFLEHRHEQAYLLAKGDPALPCAPLPDVQGWRYTGNRLHPTQKPVDILRPLVRAFTPAGGLILDPFCGSGSSLVAANDEAGTSSVSSWTTSTGKPHDGGSREPQQAPHGASFMLKGFRPPPAAEIRLRSLRRNLGSAFAPPDGQRRNG